MPNAQEVLDWIKFDKERKANMTNEQWFCGLSTEEKAKTIICLAVNSMHKKRKGLIENDVNEIMRWLKEKHHE